MGPVDLVDNSLVSLVSEDFLDSEVQTAMSQDSNIFWVHRRTYDVSLATIDTICATLPSTCRLSKWTYTYCRVTVAFRDVSRV